MTPNEIYLGSAQDVEEEINVGPVENGETVKHEDLGIGLRRLGEEALLKSRLKIGKKY